MLMNAVRCLDVFENDMYSVISVCCVLNLCCKKKKKAKKSEKPFRSLKRNEGHVKPTYPQYLLSDGSLLLKHWKPIPWHFAMK